MTYLSWRISTDVLKFLINSLQSHFLLSMKNRLICVFFLYILKNANKWDNFAPRDKVNTNYSQLSM